MTTECPYCEKGFEKIAVPSYRPNYCTADNIHSFAFLPNKKVHKCWHLVGQEDETIGKLKGEKIKFNHNLYKWLAYDPFDKEKCRSCSYLPLCMGGCPKVRLQTGKAKCNKLKNSILKYMELLITKKMD